MATSNLERAVSHAAERARPLRALHDLQPLIEEIAPARVVMLGESSHGTQEFYEWRRLISQELIANHGFHAIVVEGDWPPCWQLNSYVHGEGASDARQPLRAFSRWPTWMWANTEIVQLADWLRTHNEGREPSRRAGFYGLDVYSLFESIDALLAQLEKVNPFLARKASARYECFDRVNGDEMAYARHLLELPAGCEEQVLLSLQELLAARLYDSDSRTPPFRDRLFNAEQNARIVANAERYYRVMMHGTDDSWNVRDRHMQETLEILLQRYGPDTKLIVWAHNTHIGDYRATDMAAEGQVNLGGLAREALGAENVKLVGFGTYRGEVIASRSWDGPIEVMRSPAGEPGSYEALFHRVCEHLGSPACYLSLSHVPKGDILHETRGHRAVGVVYCPSHERLGNYVPTQLAARYDAFLFFDETRALEPLEQDFNRAEIPETWPQGF